MLKENKKNITLLSTSEGKQSVQSSSGLSVYVRQLDTPAKSFFFSKPNPVNECYSIFLCTLLARSASRTYLEHTS